MIFRCPKVAWIFAGHTRRLSKKAHARLQEPYMAIHYARVEQIESHRDRLATPPAGHHGGGQGISMCSRHSTIWASTTTWQRLSDFVFTRSAWCGRLSPKACRSSRPALKKSLEVVEEKRQVLEYQLQRAAVQLEEDVRPQVVGKFDAKGEWVRHTAGVLPAPFELTPAMIARVIAGRIAKFYVSDKVKGSSGLTRKSARSPEPKSTSRVHRISAPAVPTTRAPKCRTVRARSRAWLSLHLALDGSRRDVYADGRRGRAVDRTSAVHEREAHLRELKGEQYLPAARACLRFARALRCGCKHHVQILYNDAVAMTGGQPRWSLSPLTILNQVVAEGVKKVCVITDEPAKYEGIALPANCPVYHRERLDEIQREFREVQGCSIIVYDQTYAAEKRRRRNRQVPDPAKRVVINEAVCEGCGDCGVKSNCVSVVPLETEFGRKRTIDPIQLQQRFLLCVNGFCPSFVTIEGGALKGNLRKSVKLSLAICQIRRLPRSISRTTFSPRALAALAC